MVKGLVVKKPKPATQPRVVPKSETASEPAGSIQSALKAPEKRPADGELGDAEKRAKP